MGIDGFLVPHASSMRSMNPLTAVSASVLRLEAVVYPKSHVLAGS
jgi:hypothetical protein